jgi:hypothetical protein
MIGSGAKNRVGEHRADRAEYDWSMRTGRLNRTVRNVFVEPREVVRHGPYLAAMRAWQQPLARALERSLRLTSTTLIVRVG